jgi:hypothetical protein
MTLLAVRTAASQPLSPAELSRIFVRGTDACRDGRVNAAVEMYNEILRQGYYSAELFHNLGVAQLAAGDTGHAVLSCSRAHWLTPRDSDIRKGLAAAVAASRTAPVTTGADWLEILSLGEWALAALIAYWLLLVLALLCRLMGYRRVLPGLIGLAAAFLCLAVVGIGHWTNRLRQNEAVVVRKGIVDARMAPTSAASATCALREGSVVTVLETWEGWSRVACTGRNGWVPDDAVDPVWPPTSKTLPLDLPAP